MTSNGESRIQILLGDVPGGSRSDDSSDIAIMTAGSKIPSPAQLLTMEGVQGIMMTLLSLFDWVIIDGPPITSFPDSTSIAGACGAAMLVIEAESTRAEVVEEAKRILESTGVDILGAVLNRRRYHIPGFIYRRL